MFSYNLRILVAVFMAVLGIGGLTAQDVYVDASAPDGGNGTTWATAYKQLHVAINSTESFSGKTFHIAEGTYRTHAPGSPADSKVLFTARGTLSFIGGYPSGGGTANPDSNPTIITGDLAGDCQGEGDQQVMFKVAGNQNSTLNLQGLTLEHTWGTVTAHGAVAITGPFSKLVVDRCVFREMYGVSGAAIDARTIRGGLVEIRNSLFQENQANNGGAIFISAGGSNDAPKLIIDNCDFVRNEAFSINGAISLSGLFKGSSIDRCLFEGNTAGKTGAVMNYARFLQTGLTVSRSVFLNNIGGGKGSILNLQGQKVGTKVSFLNCLFLQNNNFIPQPLIRVGNNAQARFVNCTFHENAESNPTPIFLYGIGKGLRNTPANSSLSIQNSLFTDNHLGAVGLIYNSPNNITRISNLVQKDSGMVQSTVLYKNVANPRGADKIWGTSDDGLNLVDGGIASASGEPSSLLTEGMLDLGGVAVDLANPSIGAYGNGTSFMPLITSVEAIAPNSCAEPNGEIRLATNLGLGSEATLSYNGQSYTEVVGESGIFTIGGQLESAEVVQNISLSYQGNSTAEIAEVVIPALEPPVILEITTEAASYTEEGGSCSGIGDGVITMVFEFVPDGFYKITYQDEAGIDREFTKVEVADGMAELKGIGAGAYQDMKIETSGCVSEPMNTVVLEE